MATEVQLRRGTTAQHATFTGAVAEVTYDTEKKTLIVHDGATAGGFELARVGAGGSVALADITDWPASVSVTEVSYLDGLTGAVQTQLNGKAASSHAHTISDVTGLQTTLDGKSATGHGHAISDVTGLQTALDGKVTPDGSATLTSKTIHGSANTLTVDGTEAVGFKRIPVSGAEKTTGYTLATGDVGKMILVGSGGGVTAPNSTFAAGDVVSIFNNTAGDITITGAITTMYLAGEDADKATLTLATRGLAVITFISATVAVVSGNVS